MKTYLEMNEKVADILRHGDKIEQYAAQYIEELRKENAELKHRAEVAERALKLACKTIAPSYVDTAKLYFVIFIEQAEKELSKEQT